ERLLALRGDLFFQELVGGGYEIGPAQPLDRRRLGIGRRAPRGQDRGQPTARRDRPGARKAQEPPPGDPSHGLSSLAHERIAPAGKWLEPTKLPDKLDRVVRRAHQPAFFPRLAEAKFD